MNWQDIVNIIVSDYVFKLIYSAIVAYPAALLVTYIKLKYDLDSYSIKFNPFDGNSINKIVDLSEFAQKKFIKQAGQSKDKLAT